MSCQLAIMTTRVRDKAVLLQKCKIYWKKHLKPNCLAVTFLHRQTITSTSCVVTDSSFRRNVTEPQGRHK